LANRPLGLWSMVMVKNSYLCLASLLTLSACHTPPPRPWLRYELDGGTDWSPLGAGKFGGTIHGASVSIDVYSPDTRVLVLVENTSDQAVTFGVGPDAGGSKGKIGEVLLRQIDSPAEGGPDMRSYVSMQPLSIDAGWRATFYLDRPLGRDVQLGQYFVLGVECESAAGDRVRRVLPLMGRISGTVPVGSK